MASTLEAANRLSLCNPTQPMDGPNLFPSLAYGYNCQWGGGGFRLSTGLLRTLSLSVSLLQFNCELLPHPLNLPTNAPRLWHHSTSNVAVWQLQPKDGTDGATTFSGMNSSGQVTIFRWILTTAWCLVVRLRLGKRLDLVSGCAHIYVLLSTVIVTVPSKLCVWQ